MTTDALETSTHADSAQKLAELVSRAQSLYSLPAVAAEVIELTSNPKVDTLALKECIQTDPALTAKILRVVNSSLFGLSREVSDLNQALALLGTKPLKLLVLGFSLPEALFRDLAREQLDWYWSTTLARAVAARTISEELFNTPGDEAFLAGLLQEIGVLVLLGQLQEPYAEFLTHVIRERVDLQKVEVDSLGFDHLALTAALLKDWQMPALYVKAISEPHKLHHLAKQNETHSQLARTLHMASLLAELVGNSRLDVLPDLLEVCEKYCGMDREQLNQLMGQLQPQVKQLAEVLSLQLPEDKDYQQLLTDAHQQMSLLAESIAEPLSRTGTEEKSYANVMAGASHLRTAVDAFLQRPLLKDESERSLPAATSDSRSLAHGTPNATPTDHSVNTDEMRFKTTLTISVGQSRSLRQPISLVILGITGESTNNPHHQTLLDQVLNAACLQVTEESAIIEPRGLTQRVVILPDHDRQQSVRYAQQMLDCVQATLQHLEAKGTTMSCLAGAGVASVTLPPRNFPPLDLFETAERCLAAAHSGDSATVKSLEIY